MKIDEHWEGWTLRAIKNVRGGEGTTGRCDHGLSRRRRSLTIKPRTTWGRKWQQWWFKNEKEKDKQSSTTAVAILRILHAVHILGTNKRQVWSVSAANSCITNTRSIGVRVRGAAGWPPPPVHPTPCVSNPGCYVWPSWDRHVDVELLESSRVFETFFRQSFSSIAYHGTR